MEAEKELGPCANSVVRSAVGRWRCSCARSAFRLALRPSMVVYQCTRPLQYERPPADSILPSCRQVHSCKQADSSVLETRNL